MRFAQIMHGGTPFKQVAARNGIGDGMSDYITGHAPATVARGYGAPTIERYGGCLEEVPTIRGLKRNHWLEPSSECGGKRTKWR